MENSRSGQWLVASGQSPLTADHYLARFTLILISCVNVTLPLTTAVARMVRFCRLAGGVPAGTRRVILASFAPAGIVMPSAVTPFTFGGSTSSTLNASL